jgi:uncharacterized protein
MMSKVEEEERKLSEVVEKAEKKLKEVFQKANVDSSHGILHARKVLSNADLALKSTSRSDISSERATAIRLAALLHDADDKKYFDVSKYSDTPYQNAQTICREVGVGEKITSEVLKMIGWVSCSKNGNSVPEEARKNPELLWPRWSDRLEAAGEIGVARCYLYNKHCKAPLSSPKTPRPQNVEEVWKLATPERFAKYQSSGGGSVSMIDHYYDKLLSVARPPPEIVQNPFLEKQAKESAGPLLKVCLIFGRTGEVPVDFIEDMAKKHGLLENSK